MSIRLLIFDDQELVRTGFRLFLETQDDLDVVGEASDGEEAIERARQLQPDVILMDIRMPRMDGIEATARLTSAGIEPPPRVLVLTTFDLDEYVFGALRAGAAGFLLKDAPAEDLARAIRSAIAGERIVDPGLAAAALSEGSSPLTAREHDVLAAAREHATVADIAAALHLSPGTVRNYLSAAIGKVGARNRVEAIRTAEDKGWL
jgi:two-component system response regulator DesR